MKLPVDVSAVLKEATQIDESRKVPLVVSLFIDESAPGDLQAFVRQEFASAAANARVSINYFPSSPVVSPNQADMAVIAAGLDEKVGEYAQQLRDAGVPVMIVTTLPQLVRDIAQTQGHPLLEEDVLAPVVKTSGCFDKKEQDASDTSADLIALNAETLSPLRLRMGEWIVATCREKREAFAYAFKFVRKPLSLESVFATAAQNAGVGLVVFIPGADMPIMTLNQAKMLLQIAAAYGQPMDAGRIKELAALVGGAFACRSVARQLVAFVPGLGWAIKGGIGYAGTLAMGRAAVEYFEGDGKIDNLARSLAKTSNKVVQTVRRSPLCK